MLQILYKKGHTETEAELVDASQNLWSISGFKWFSSATTADMTMLLARAKDPQSGEFKEVRYRIQYAGNIVTCLKIK